SLYQLLDVAFAAIVAAAAGIATLVEHCDNADLQPAFTTRIRQRLDAAVALDGSTGQRQLDGAGGFCALGSPLACLAGRVALPSGTATQFFGGGSGACQNLAAVGRDDLGINVLRRAVHAQAHDFELVHLQACLASATQSGFFLDGHLLGPTSSWLLYDGRLRPRNAHPCPCTALADGSRGSQRPPDPPTACRYP